MRFNILYIQIPLFFLHSIQKMPTLCSHISDFFLLWTNTTFVSSPQAVTHAHVIRVKCGWYHQMRQGRRESRQHFAFDRSLYFQLGQQCATCCMPRLFLVVVIQLHNGQSTCPDPSIAVRSLKPSHSSVPSPRRFRKKKVSESTACCVSIRD